MALSVRRMGLLTTNKVHLTVTALIFVAYFMIKSWFVGLPPNCLHAAGDGPSAAVDVLLPPAGDGEKRSLTAAGDDRPASADTPSPYYIYDSLPYEHLLNPDFMPNVVYYVWCGRRWFEFQHYLSVMSVVRQLRPDNIVFFYDVEPVVDVWTYNTWYSEIADSCPFFRRRRVLTDEPACMGHSTPNMTFVLANLLTANGGMYVNEQTILSRYPLNFRLKDLVVAFDPTSVDDSMPPALLATKHGLPGRYVANSHRPTHGRVVPC